MWGRLVSAALGITFIAPIASYAGDGARTHHPRSVNAREHRQSARIQAGVAKNELTRGELKRLRANEAAIRAEERVYRRSGDGLGPRERRDLQRDLNRTSRQIYRAAHNNRVPASAR